MEEVQPSFRAFVARTFGDEGRAWLASLPDLLTELSSRWRLTLGPELPGGLLSYVRAAVTASGAPVVHGNRRPGRRARLDALVAAAGLPRERVRDWAGIVGVHG